MCSRFLPARCLVQLPPWNSGERTADLAADCSSLPYINKQGPLLVKSSMSRGLSEGQCIHSAYKDLVWASGLWHESITKIGNNFVPHSFIQKASRDGTTLWMGSHACVGVCFWEVGWSHGSWRKLTTNSNLSLGDPGDIAHRVLHCYPFLIALS